MRKEDLPSTKHEHWAENMEAFRVRSKERIDMIKAQALETKSVDKTVESAKKEAPMKKSLSVKGNETETKPVDKSNKVKSRSAAGKFHKNQALIAVWTNDDIVSWRRIPTQRRMGRSTERNRRQMRTGQSVIPGP